MVYPSYHLLKSHATFRESWLMLVLHTYKLLVDRVKRVRETRAAIGMSPITDFNVSDSINRDLHCISRKVGG
jgi:hypothetical protein